MTLQHIAVKKWGSLMKIGQVSFVPRELVVEKIKKKIKQNLFQTCVVLHLTKNGNQL